MYMYVGWKVLCTVEGSVSAILVHVGGVAADR